MKIARVEFAGKTRLALVDEQKQEVALVGGELAAHPNPILAIIEQGIKPITLLAAVTEHVPMAQVKFLAPLSAFLRNPFAVGKNYHDHALEFDKSGFNATSGASAIPAYPQIFTKATTTLNGPTDPIRFSPLHTTSVDYEGEIGVVIGAVCRNVSKADAMKHVWGFVAMNDVTARDLQKNHAQWFLGKSLDGFCPLGPWMTTRDEAPTDMRMQTWVNGEQRQDAHISQLIFDVPTLIETMSAAMTLLPGDIIATGTSVGVGVGFTPPKFLRQGDVVRVAISGLGELNNPVEEII
ncbi:MAG: fumarylacetoacetate hydrolase family protein [Gammaproteobacteria bacterium]|jgi:2-keto-4-pentenoate hydratase/2-oxohepta-3-ene-1,7-dioic acid hydratase in catechol pathway|nr:fumarylacetoacetate hydrolase family protein [Gammaproteobacteria bacterium]MBU0788090.1 fumarylacetoacetate hydrolase family protein [Gammaproteobacteria bacterium]MBU0815412.1 fumarylacetoacetate hydrolase family protein [Gammaproteobacteria bacterium]MBU1785480.1 fumarylacetoacetate hydrolase family protein [Gammaproteobacteria bacterium]